MKKHRKNSDAGSNVVVRNALRLFLSRLEDGYEKNLKNLVRASLIPENRLKRILRNASQPSFEETWKLATYLGVSMDEIYSVRVVAPEP